MNAKGFSLIELLTVVGILAILGLVLIYLLNPAQLLTEGRDGSRVSSISALDKAISLYYSNALNTPGTLFMGTSSVIYVSIPDPNATTTAGTNCAGMGFPATTSTYHCAAPSAYLKVDGTGWVPINFATFPGGSPISKLPVDPTNTTSSNEFFVYVTDGVGGYELMANPAYSKDASDTSDFVKGTNTNLLTSFP
jgi:prepilin-type N-terminal cleavage/methylation domain-containing protein